MSDLLPLSGLDPLLADWSADAPARAAFVALRDHLAALPGTALAVRARPGVSWSLRATAGDPTERPLFVLVDVIDDDPADRWLSVCFYDDMITDPEERGDWVPKGLMGCDARCFNIDADAEPDTEQYVKARLDEAHAKAAG
ncbi:hypothetical protein [Nitratidesulfovibrio vulgaris]|uniref:hypothetical protein n=1 Tax=Nitratidesulfovibrio vulgaris TaxID=881 RepID=UPI0013E07117|nr:hypothetical protein [Nitratidesulfovibrio vulgaris]